MTAEQLIQKEKEERLEHQNTLTSINIMMSNPHGKRVIKYLLKSFDYGGFPPTGLRGEDLLEYTAFLRAGNSVYKMILEASPELTGDLITEMEKERQNENRKFTKNEPSE